jgi:large conductance mechanosensitive channel
VIKEFRDFINRGNVVDLAVAVVLGTAFTAVVTSLVNDVLLQIIAVIVGKPDFSDLTITVNDAVIRYGSFITAVVSFLLIAVSVFFIVKAYNHLKDMGAASAEGEEPPPSEADLLAEIRDLLKQRSA